MEPHDDDEPHPPIGYRNPADDAPAAGRRRSLALAGGGCGLALPVVVGLLLALNTGGRLSHVVTLGFALAAVGGVAGGVYALRPAHRRWFLATFLLALGVTAAVEGACFGGMINM